MCSGALRYVLLLIIMFFVMQANNCYYMLILEHLYATMPMSETILNLDMQLTRIE